MLLWCQHNLDSSSAEIATFCSVLCAWIPPLFFSKYYFYFLKCYIVKFLGWEPFLSCTFTDVCKVKSQILATICRECDARDVDNAQNSSICTIKEFVLPVKKCKELAEQKAFGNILMSFWKALPLSLKKTQISTSDFW